MMLRKLFQQLKLAKFIFTFCFLFSTIFLPASSVFAQEHKEAFVTIVNPVRGKEFWQYDFSPLDTPQGQYDMIKKNGLVATWLLRFDAYTDPEIASFFKKISSTHELGIFFEITPGLTEAAGVTYNQSDSWHKAKSVFLTGYSVDDRKKLITTAFEKFKEVFGLYPTSVGAWWIDANSLTFMRQNYGIAANLAVSDQFSTDDYQVWGMPFSTTFYPAKKNALVPAQSPENKIGVVTLQWAQRDPFNGYGPGVQESTYSVQVNDYVIFHNLDFSYFEKLYEIYGVPNFFNKFAQLTVGVENDFSWKQLGSEYTSQIEFVAKKHTQGQTKAVTMSGFANWYKTSFTRISPPNLVFAGDPLGGPGKVVWFNNENYRLGWFYHPELYGSAVRDLRVYNDSSVEQCYATACSVITLAQTVSKPLDEATFGDRWTIDEGAISDFSIKKNLPAGRQENERILISYKNAGGKARSFELASKDLYIDGEGVTVPGAILNVLTSTKQGPGKISLGIPTERFGIDYLKIFTNLLFFLVFSTFSFFLPGVLLLNSIKIKSSPLEKIVVGTVLGLVIFVLANFLFSWIKLSILANIVLLIAAFFQLYNWRKNLRAFRVDINYKILILIFLITIGVLSQGMTVFKSGLSYDFGLGFWGPNGHDGVWHLSLAENLAKNFPPQNPILAGAPLRNYHYFYDFLLAKTHNLTKIPINDLYFRYFPILISLFFGLAVFILVRKMTNSDGASVLAVFLSYFGGSFGWIITFVREGKLGGESMFWASQAVSFLLNPPFAISLVIFLVGLLIFHQFLETRKTILIIPIAILWGSLIQFKAYAGILVLASLAILLVWEILIKKKMEILKLGIATFFVSFIIFAPNNFGSPNLLVFSPFWFVHTMVEYQDRFFWLRLANARNAYLMQGWWWKLILAEILGLLIFLVGNLGTRILVVGQIFNWAKRKFAVTPFYLFLTVFLIFAILLPLLFIQKGTAWNTIQFFYYFMVIAGISASIFFWQIISKLPKIALGIAIVVLVLLTIPTTIGNASHYLPSRPPARLPLGEFQALEFLRKEPDGTILARAFDKKAKEKFDLPLPLFVYETTAYVSAFSGKPVFIEDEVNLEIMGVSYKDRVVGAKEFFKIRDENFAGNFLRNNHIKYIYVTKFEKFEPNEKSLGIKKIFENDEVKIYEVI